MATEDSGTPSSFGRYRVLGVAGTGGMGTVYRAVDDVLERPVALKVLSPHLAGDAEMRERLARESVHAASLQHPNAVTVYDAGEVDGSLFLVMRWIDGRDLEGLIAQDGPLEPWQAVAVVEQVAGALDAAHAGGLVHRDVKPANVLVDGEGGAFLTDFGVTKDISGAAGAATATGQMLGTVDYIAPEVADGGPADARADVYGLGALAFKALTGHVPFERDGTVARVLARVTDPPPSARALRPDIPLALDEAVARALATRPEDRFVSAGEFAAAARAAMGGEAVLPGVAAGATAALAAGPTEALAAAAAPPTAAHEAVAPVAPARRRVGRRAAVLTGVLVAGVLAAVVVAAGAGGGGAPQADAAGKNATASTPGSAAAAVTPGARVATTGTTASKNPKHRRRARGRRGAGGGGGGSTQVGLGGRSLSGAAPASPGQAPAGQPAPPDQGTTGQSSPPAAQTTQGTTPAQTTSTSTTQSTTTTNQSTSTTPSTTTTPPPGG